LNSATFVEEDLQARVDAKIVDDGDALSCCNDKKTQNLIGSSFSIAALSTSSSNSVHKHSFNYYHE
jgi:hypothetical protein